MCLSLSVFSLPLAKRSKSITQNSSSDSSIERAGRYFETDYRLYQVDSCQCILLVYLHTSDSVLSLAFVHLSFHGKFHDGSLVNINRTLLYY